MIRIAASLRPHPERDYLAKEAEAERLAALPPNPFTLATEALDALENGKGREAAIAHVEAWLRPRKPKPKARMKGESRVVVFKRANAHFSSGKAVLEAEAQGI